MSALGTFFGWIIMRDRHRRLLSRFDEQDAVLKEMPARVAGMIGKPEAEQKKIAADISARALEISATFDGGLDGDLSAGVALGPPPEGDK